MPSAVEDTALGLRELRYKVSVPICAYSHASGRKVSPQEFLDHAQKWVQIGAQIFGVCCGPKPDHVRTLSKNFPSRLPLIH